jgi:hypothetical protein
MSSNGKKKRATGIALVNSLLAFDAVDAIFVPKHPISSRFMVEGQEIWHEEGRDNLKAL